MNISNFYKLCDELGLKESVTEDGLKCYKGIMISKYFEEACTSYQTGLLDVEISMKDGSIVFYVNSVDDASWTAFQSKKSKVTLEQFFNGYEEEFSYKEYYLPSESELNTFLMKHGMYGISD